MKENTIRKFILIVLIDTGWVMAKNILITQRLQNDYLSYLHPDANLPCVLHVGSQESQRLVGTDVKEGVITRFLKSVYNEKKHSLDIVHIIEEHNLSDPEQSEEIKIFGIHCVEGTKGVEPITAIRLKDKTDPFTRIIKSKGKNDFYSSDIASVLEKLIGNERKDEVSVYIIGVRTELNIRYLIYDLKFRLGVRKISVCSALTSTSNRRLHYDTLKHLRDNFNVKIYDRMDEFYRAMGLSNLLKAGMTWDDSRQTLNFLGAKIGIFEGNNELKNIIKVFFSDYKDISLRLIAQEANGTCTYSVILMDWKFRRTEKFVIRAGNADVIAREKKSLEMIEIFLPDKKPILYDYLDLGDWGAILYGFYGEEKFQTFKDFFHVVKTTEQLVAFNDIVDKIIVYFRRLHKRSRKRRITLGDYYIFDNEDFLEKFRAECSQLIGHIPANEYISLKNFQIKIFNPVHFFSQQYSKNVKLDCYFGVTHGNLSADSILMGEEFDNIYLINYSTIEEALVLDDIAAFEVDIKLLSDITGQEQLNLFINFEKFLLSSKGLQLYALPEEFGSTQYRKLYEALKRIRTFTDFITFSESSLLEYLIALIKHTANRLIDPTLSRNLKVFAFISLGLMMEKFLIEINKLKE